jgi:biopolymer transport protein ExbD
MAMSIAKPNGEVISDMNTTPLIDVMLVLLVMLIITLPLGTHAVKIDLPTAPRALDDLPPLVMLNVDFDGAVEWNGRHVDRATLDRYLALAARQEQQPEIRVFADRLAKYDAVAKVLADAQRLGVKRIAIVGTERYAAE